MVMELKRKGDVTISTIILIVLGLVVLVMLILGFTQGFDTIFGIFDRAPSELQTLASACEVYVQGKLSIDFCSYRIVEVDGKDQIVNCEDGRIDAILKSKALDPSTISCTNIDNLASVCNQIPQADKDKVLVNNKGKCPGAVGNKCTGGSPTRSPACSTFTSENCPSDCSVAPI